MPNWCNNSVEMWGPQDKIDAIVRAATGEMDSKDRDLPYGMLSYMVPVTEGSDGITRSQTQAWGTKWDVTDAEVVRYDELDTGEASVILVFDTAWSPPIECFEKWFAENEDCNCILDYFEPGIAFVGRFTPDDGESTWEYGAATADTVRDLVPDQIVDLWELDSMMAEMEAE